MGDVDPAVRAAAASRFALVAATGEVLDAMAGARIRTVLLKGPATARLYRDPALRSAEDVDLLVEPSQAGTAAEVLESLGFRNPLAKARSHEREAHAVAFYRSGALPACIDLHRTCTGVTNPCSPRDCGSWTPETPWRTRSVSKGTALPRSLRLRLAGPPPIALAVMRLAQMPSVRQRVAVVLGEVFPTPPAMRYWEWIRRTERAALTLGYLYRPFWFAFKLPDAYRASRAANICSVRTSALGSAHERAREGFRAPDRFG